MPLQSEARCANRCSVRRTCSGAESASTIGSSDDSGSGSRSADGGSGVRAGSELDSSVANRECVVSLMKTVADSAASFADGASESEPTPSLAPEAPTVKKPLGTRIPRGMSNLR